MEKTALIIGGIAVVGILAYLAYKKTLTATTAGQLRVGPAGVSGTINLQPIESALGGLIGAASSPSGNAGQNTNLNNGLSYLNAPTNSTSTGDSGDGFDSSVDSLSDFSDPTAGTVGY
jgi:hypothetical protein